MNNERILEALNDYSVELVNAIKRIESEYARDDIDTETYFRRVTHLEQLLGIAYRYRILIKRRIR